MNKMWHIIVKIWKSNTIFGTNRLSYNNFIDVIEFIPIFISKRQKKAHYNGTSNVM